MIIRLGLCWLFIFLPAFTIVQVHATTTGTTPTGTPTSTKKHIESHMSKTSDTTAIIIGAGPSGLATALGLSNVCRKVLLVEKHPTFEKRGATFGMGVNGQKALDELRPGLKDYMTNIGLSSSAGGALVFVWWEMRDALLKYVKESENVELYCGEEFTHIDDEEEQVTVKFKSGLELCADLLVGADGVHSDVRDVLNLSPPIVSETTNFRGHIHVPDSASPELRGLLDGGLVPLYSADGKEIYFVLFNFNERYPGRLAWILSTSLDVDGEKWNPFTIAREFVSSPEKLKLIEEILHLSHQEDLKPYPKTSIIDMSDDALRHLGGGWGGKGRITLVGDAAHGMRPTDGYGGSMALEDAVVLSRRLREKSEPISAMLRRFESERLPRVKRVYDNQYERYAARMEHGQRLGPQSEEFLEWLVAGV